MNVFWPAASRFVGRTSKTCTARISGQRGALSSKLPTVRSFGLSSRSSRWKVFDSEVDRRSNPFTAQFVRAFATTRGASRSGRQEQEIVTRYEDVPENYRDEDGLPFRSTPLSSSEVLDLFGVGIDVSTANHLTRVLHGRRVAGTLADPSLPSRDKRINNIALTYLRNTLPVDEEDAAGQRAEMELEAMEADILADGERLGLYKPQQQDTDIVDGTEAPKSVYGRTGLDEIRETIERQRVAREEANEAIRRQAEEIRGNTGPTLELSTQDRARMGQVVLRTPGQNPRLKYFIAKGESVAPEVLPEMTVWQRLWPSALVALLVIGTSVLLAQIYVPPSHSARLWQDIPPAAATILGLITANIVGWALWRMPPAYAMMNKYFMVVPGYPRALAILGCVFSHQEVKHLVFNMAVLWLIGTRLHDDVGRANFLSIYLSCGVTAALFSLSAFTLKKSFVTTSLGASGAIAGITAAYLWLHGSSQFKVLGLPPDPMQGPSGHVLLGLALVGEVVAQRRGKIRGPRFDHYAHFGGYGSGVAAAELLKRRIERRRLEERERRKNMSVVDRIKEWHN